MDKYDIILQAGQSNADGYGHGAVPIAKKLEKDCNFFGVATLSEAQEL